MARGDHRSEQHSDRLAADDGDRLLSRLALKQGMVTEEQVVQAVALQDSERARGKDLTLGEALVRLKWISPRQYERLQRARALTIQRKCDCMFARVVLRNGLATQADVDEMIRRQSKLYKETGDLKPLGGFLREAGLISARQHQAINSAIGRNLGSAGGKNADVDTGALRAPGGGQPLVQREEPKTTSVEFTPITPGESASGLEESALEVKVSPDRLFAFLVVNKKLPDTYSVSNLRDFLGSKSIVFGVLDDASLTEVIRSDGGLGKPLKVAQGIPPEMPRAAEIQLLIEPELKTDLSGDLAGGSVIDLKDRGLIPQVRKGDVLARKIPFVPGIEGVDVHGQEIPVPDAKDVMLLTGSGVELSNDRLEVVAKVDGRPQVSAFGRISVLPELVIRGDVSFETGNIDFAGSIVVGGVVQDGFKVRGGSLIASEIGKADIEVDGEVVVLGGILGARVFTQASVRSMHIHASRIEAMGDVIAEKGIVDSRISTSGRCIAKKGTVLSSSIVARQGIEAVNVGSDRSKPCTFGIGFDPLAEKQAESCKAMLAVEREELDRQKAAVQELKAQLEEVEKQIGELAQEQDLALRQQRSHQARIEEAEKAGDHGEATALRAGLADVENRIHEAGQNLDKLLEWQDQLKSVIGAHKDRIQEMEARILQLKNELSAITDWASSPSGRPLVKVHGSIFAGTSIKGPFSSVTLRENYKGVAFGERTEPGADAPGAGRPRIVMQRLKR